MNHTKTQKTLPIEDFAGRILTTRRNINKNNAFSWPKNTARGVRFLLGFNVYLFLALCEQVYLFLAFAPKKNSHLLTTQQRTGVLRTPYIYGLLCD